MKKVLMCIPSLGTGGAERFAVDLALGVDKTRYEIIFVETRNQIDGIFRDMLIEANIRIVDLSDKSLYKMLKKQIFFLKKEKPDIVHANIGSLLHMMISCKICRVPKRFYTVHNEAKLLFGENKIKKMLYQLAFTFFGFIPVAICPTVKKTLLDEFNLDSKDIPIVKNGVNIDKFTPLKDDDKNLVINIVVVGTLYWIKNQKIAIEAIARLYKKGYKVVLSLIGDGEDKEMLQQLIIAENANGYINILGRKNNIEKYLQKSDIYLSTSKTEGLPLSILEAMACGLPIVATAVGGVVDIVENNRNGFIVNSGDLEELVTALEKLVCSETLRREYGKQSRIISEEWSLKSCIAGYQELYEKER